MDGNISFGPYDITGTGIITGGIIVKSGGTDRQYLMANGSVLQQSAVSGNSNFYIYSNKSGVTTPPVISGGVGYNNSSQASATVVYINCITSDAINIEVFSQFINTLSDLYIQSKSVSTDFIRYNITGTPTIVSGSYMLVPVLLTSSGGLGSTSFGTIDVLVSFFSNNKIY